MRFLLVVFFLLFVAAKLLGCGDLNVGGASTDIEICPPESGDSYDESTTMTTISESYNSDDHSDNSQTEKPIVREY